MSIRSGFIDIMGRWDLIDWRVVRTKSVLSRGFGWAGATAGIVENQEILMEDGVVRVFNYRIVDLSRMNDGAVVREEEYLLEQFVATLSQRI